MSICFTFMSFLGSGWFSLHAMSRLPAVFSPHTVLAFPGWVQDHLALWQSCGDIMWSSVSTNLMNDPKEGLLKPPDRQKIYAPWCWNVCQHLPQKITELRRGKYTIPLWIIQPTSHSDASTEWWLGIFLSHPVAQHPIQWIQWLNSNSFVLRSGEMHEFNETAHLVELEAEDEEEHIHEVLHGAPSRAGFKYHWVSINH